MIISNVRAQLQLVCVGIVQPPECHISYHYYVSNACAELILIACNHNNYRMYPPALNNLKLKYNQAIDVTAKLADINWHLII